MNPAIVARPPQRLANTRTRASRYVGRRARRDAHAESDVDVAVLLDGQPGKFVETKLAMRLRAQGLNAHALGGGIDGWQAAGRPLAERPKG